MNLRFPAQLLATAFVCLALSQSACAQETAAGEPVASAPDPGSMMVSSFDGLLKLLNADSVTHRANVEKQLVVIPTEKNGVDSVFVIRWAEPDGVVHFIHQIPVSLPEDRLRDVEVAMMRLNHAMAIPGLGINHDANAMYFRMTVAVQPRGGLTGREVRAFFSNTLNQSEKWRPVMTQVISGEAPAEGIVQYCNQQQQTTASSFPGGTMSGKAGGSEWVLKFADNATLTLHRDGELGVNSTYQVKGNRIRFVDVDGPLATKEPGIYEWKIDGNQVKFSKLEDQAGGRAMVLTGTVWAIAP